MHPTTCPIEMSDVLPCGRPIHAAPAGCDETPVCLMHSRDPNKSQKEFDAEIKAILEGTSPHHRPKDLFDFGGFVFVVADFHSVTFTQGVYFSGATFCYTDFSKAKFIRYADFGGATFLLDADFAGATFIQRAHFVRATFTQLANFLEATFNEEAGFGGATFTREANFSGLAFTKEASFSEATFTKTASFVEATFIEEALFGGAIFTEGADFGGATFTEAALFDDSVFGLWEASTTPVETIAIADFRSVRFLRPELVRFRRTNRNATEGLRARFVNCHVEGVQFDAVNWHQSDGRMVLQDELDILDQAKHAPSHEETAIAYRRLISNFEQARAYDLVEDCTIGEFEMKRRDSSRFPFATVLGSFYERFPLLRHWVGEQLSVVRFYRLASVYGTSYYRALAVLGFLLIGFGVLFSTVVAIKPMNINAISICSQSSARGALCAGLTHAVEVAALQKDLLYVPVSSSGRMTEVLEQVLIAGQVALLLFALSRRFRR